MANVTVRIRKDRLKKDGTAPIEVMIFHNNKSTSYSLKRSVNPKFWDSNSKRIKGGDVKTRSLTNSIINKEMSKVSSAIDNLIFNNENITLDKIRTLIKKRPNHQKISLADYLSVYIDENPRGISYATKRYYKSTLNIVKLYFKNKAISDIDYKDIGDFAKYLETDQKNKPNTIFNKMKVLKRVFKQALEDHYIKFDPTVKYTHKREQSKRTFLNKSELEKIEGYTASTELYDLVKNVFLFATYSGGLRFGDLCKLTKNDFDIDGNDKGADVRIHLKTGKTGETVTFKLPQKAKKIFWKYYSADSALLFPIVKNPKDLDDEVSRLRVISRRNAYFNKAIKAIAKKINIDKVISMHIARHTFATISLSLGIPTEIISKILGHRSLATTAIYVKIMDSEKIKLLLLGIIFRGIISPLSLFSIPP